MHDPGIETERDVLQDLIQALPSAVLFCVLPGWFWAACLHPRSDLVERLAFSTGYAMALVAPAALLQARLFGSGVTLAVAAISALTVFVAGLVAYLALGPADDPEEPPFPVPAPPGTPALVLISLALGLALVTALTTPDNGWYAFATALLVLAAGAVAWLEASRSLRPGSSRTPGTPSRLSRILCGVALAAVLAGTLARGYSGVVLHDWPYLRGGDQYNHAVMANELLSQGDYDAYLAAYPPGFALLSAGVSRLSTLEPLEIYPVLAPALLVLPALACYALARGLWGPWCGVGAAAFSGLLLMGTYANIEQARYPNLVSAQFLLVLAVTALVALYRRPSARTVFSFALLGSSIVLYHPVGSLYAALLFALVSILILPYLLLRERRSGVALLCSLAILGLLAVLFAWNTYDLPGLVGGLLTGSGSGASGESVSIVIGTQPSLDLAGLPERISPPVLWLGLLGAILLLVPYRDGADIPGQAARATMLLWCAVLFAGSRTALSGFPQRFERDLGLPLAVLGAFALVAVLVPLAAGAPREERTGASKRVRGVAAAAVVCALALTGALGWRSFAVAASPEPGAVISPEVAAAGEWLREHSSGGTIVPTPSYGSVPSRGMLAMGGYERLQAYPDKRIQTPRSLPPGGVRELKDVRWLLLNPRSERAGSIVERYDVRYVVLHKRYPGVDPRAFAARSDLYRKAFENDAVVIFAPRRSG